MNLALNWNLIVMAKFFNLLLLIAGCALGIMGAIEKSFAAAPVVILVLLLIHIALVKNHVAEAIIIIISGIIGSAVEIFNVSIGLYQYNQFTDAAALLPTWIVFIWFIVGAGIRHCFLWCSNQWYFSSSMGIVFGAAFYYAAATTGAIHFNVNGNLNLLQASLCWALAFPGIYYFNKLILQTAKNT